MVQCKVHLNRHSERMRKRQKKSKIYPKKNIYTQRHKILKKYFIWPFVFFFQLHFHHSLSLIYNCKFVCIHRKDRTMYTQQVLCIERQNWCTFENLFKFLYIFIYILCAKCIKKHLHIYEMYSFICVYCECFFICCCCCCCFC